ncbi:unnamed protein product [Toxocara canis]|uniref:Peptidase_M1 domain-containing protein n=1 Tax=Toxocara canis TaxID=6265 RepID=A0A183U3F6_TOXCA|nr:unnamed protein product [Toxocara canis]
MRDARSIMPCIDLPSMKATLDLCVTHPAGTEARQAFYCGHQLLLVCRSNSPLQKSAVDGKVTTCFARTSPMSTYLYAIAVFNRMQSMYQSADHKLHLPELEVLYPEQMSAEKPVWIKAETIQASFANRSKLSFALSEISVRIPSTVYRLALRFMSNFTGFDYPLKKLSLIITSLPLNGVENFGLINLNERWMAYPKYRMAHSILVNEIAHQWIGNLVTVKKWNEICLQVCYFKKNFLS